MSLFPADDKARKMLPVFSMLTRYFPKAMREITRVCVANNVRYNPDRDPADINWARGKSPDQLGSAFRHMLERTVDGMVFENTDTGPVYVLAEAAWRLCAALELEIEAQEGVNSAGSQQEAYYGKVDSQNPQRDSGQGLRAFGAPISDRGQESRSQCAEQSIGQRHSSGESYGSCSGPSQIPGYRLGQETGR